MYLTASWLVATVISEVLSALLVSVFFLLIFFWLIFCFIFYYFTYFYYFFYFFPTDFAWILWKTEPGAGLPYNPRAASVREKGKETNTWWYRMPVQKTLP